MGYDDTNAYAAYGGNACGAIACSAPSSYAAVTSSGSSNRKRKQPHTSPTDDSDDDIVFLGERRKEVQTVDGYQKNSFGVGQYKKENYGVGGSPLKKRKPKAPAGEKRLKKYRAKAPQSYDMIRQRAVSQRMFVIERKRGGTTEVPEEHVDIAGTTGNIYTVSIRPLPDCTCPHAQKGNQCKHIVYVLSQVLKVTAPLEWQLAFVSSELREIFENAPPIPTDDVEADSGDGKRKPIEDECPICCMEFEVGKEEIVYCKAACGNNIHKHCFEQWATAKKGSRGGVTCPFCRTAWAGDEDMVKKIAKGGKVNEEGYVNVASHLGLSGRRDYSTYHPYWVQSQARYGRI